MFQRWIEVYLREDSGPRRYYGTAEMSDNGNELIVTCRHGFLWLIADVYRFPTVAIQEWRYSVYPGQRTWK